MLKKTITFEDFDGNTRTETHYFHLSKAEIIRLQLETVTNENPDGDLAFEFQAVVESGSGKRIMDTFEKWIAKSYGVREEDGRSFRKGDDVWKNFRSSAAYDALFIELITEPDAAANFVNGLFPKNLIEQARNNRPELRDHMSKQQSPRDRHRTEQVPYQEPERPDYLPAVDPYQANVPTVEPVLAPSVKAVTFTHDQLTAMSPWDVENLKRRYAGWSEERNQQGDVTLYPPQSVLSDEPAVEGFVTRPQHEVGKGFQIAD